VHCDKDQILSSPPAPAMATELDRLLLDDEDEATASCCETAGEAEKVFGKHPELQRRVPALDVSASWNCRCALAKCIRERGELV